MSNPSDRPSTYNNLDNLLWFSVTNELNVPAEHLGFRQGLIRLGVLSNIFLHESATQQFNSKR